MEIPDSFSFNNDFTLKLALEWRQQVLGESAIAAQQIAAPERIEVIGEGATERLLVGVQHQVRFAIAGLVSLVPG